MHNTAIKISARGWVKHTSYYLKGSLLFLLLLQAGTVLAADELGPVLGSVRENFGIGSTFVKIIYLAEIIAGAYAWHKTKHPSAVIGIVILALFLTFAMTHWVFG